jgi:hypothetical protein
VSLPFSVGNKLLDEFSPLLLQVSVLDADKIVTVNNNRGNSRPSGEKMVLL